MTQDVKQRFVLDACALLRVAQAEPGMEPVRDYLYAARRGARELLMHPINLGEVIYRIAKVHGWDVADRKRIEIGLLPIVIVPFEEWVFWRAVRIKAEHPLSYADAFAASLALDREATLLTADPEFESLGERLPRIPVWPPPGHCAARGGGASGGVPLGVSRATCERPRR